MFRHLLCRHKKVNEIWVVKEDTKVSKIKDIAYRQCARCGKLLFFNAHEIINSTVENREVRWNQDRV